MPFPFQPRPNAPWPRPTPHLGLIQHAPWSDRISRVERVPRGAEELRRSRGAQRRAVAAQRRNQALLSLRAPSSTHKRSAHNLNTPAQHANARPWSCSRRGSPQCTSTHERTRNDACMLLPCSKHDSLLGDPHASLLCGVCGPKPPWTACCGPRGTPQAKACMSEHLREFTPPLPIPHALCHATATHPRAVAHVRERGLERLAGATNRHLVHAHHQEVQPAHMDACMSTITQRACTQLMAGWEAGSQGTAAATDTQLGPHTKVNCLLRCAVLPCVLRRARSGPFHSAKASRAGAVSHRLCCLLWQPDCRWLKSCSSCPAG